MTLVDTVRNKEVHHPGHLRLAGNECVQSAETSEQVGNAAKKPARTADEVKVVALRKDTIAVRFPVSRALIRDRAKATSGLPASRNDSPRSEER